MLRTIVGYAGGTTNDPTYQNIGNHAETLQIDYDPETISYAELLKIFWDSHNPAYGGAYGQYRSIILYHNEEQRKIAEKSKTEREKAAGGAFTTTISRLERFTPAELYHQKYYLQADNFLMSELLNSYSSAEELFNSTAAARINGYISGYGTTETLRLELNSYGLSFEGRQYLLKLVKR